MIGQIYVYVFHIKMTLEKLKEDEKFINMIFDWDELVRNNDLSFEHTQSIREKIVCTGTMMAVIVSLSNVLHIGKIIMYPLLISVPIMTWTI